MLWRYPGAHTAVVYTLDISEYLPEYILWRFPVTYTSKVEVPGYLSEYILWVPGYLPEFYESS